MLGNFETCFPITMAWEGWHRFSNNPKDPGGKTYCGVTQRVWDAYCDRSGIPRCDVRMMSDAQCREIYREQYWRAVHGDELPAGVDLLVWDICVNSGPDRAARILQAACGATIDGHIGMAAIAAAKAGDARSIIRALHAGRLSFWHHLKTFATFGKGWTNREKDLLTRALLMVRPPIAPPAPVKTAPRTLFATLFGG